MDDIKARYDALKESDKQAILDANRDINLDGRWWRDIYDKLIVDVNQYGYMVDETSGSRSSSGHCIWFTGFSSQGDGACFDGRIWNWSVATQNWPVLCEHIKDASVDRTFKWKSKGNYCHANTLEFEWEIDNSNIYDEATDRLRWLAAEQERKEVYAEWDKFCEATKAHVKSLCERLYENLETEHEWLTEDQQVLETLIANDMLGIELPEYEDEPEGDGCDDCSTDNSAAGSLLLRTTSDALEAGGGELNGDTCS